MVHLKSGEEMEDIWTEEDNRVDLNQLQYVRNREWRSGREMVNAAEMNQKLELEPCWLFLTYRPHLASLTIQNIVHK